MNWTERLTRVFAIDLSICPDCGGRLRVIADVTRPDVINKILEQQYGNGSLTLRTFGVGRLN